jgi:uncharacterized cupin superfamily protein
MTSGPSDGVRLIKASDQITWEEVPRPEGDTAPPGEEFIAFRSADKQFSTGLWRRVPEVGAMEPPYHEVAFIIEGEVEVTDADGTVYRAGPGDILITPNGTKAVWKSLSPVKKFWAVYKGE